uniref:Uncharacterized protein n=1 Tax=Mola mola TaxID=94237 RepID=A0A3Q3VT45_MOLML
MRSPSPTFITIESTRRTDSPQRVTPSPTLLHRPPTPPTPPPRRCDTPTSRLTRITPSPTFDRAENLPRLKDTTAKLLRGVTPPPLFPQQISERKSEIVELPVSFHRQIRTNFHLMDPPRADLFGLVNKFESLEEQLCVRKELIPVTDCLHNDTRGADSDMLKQEIPTFDIQAIKNVFEIGEQSPLFWEKKKKQEEPVSNLTETEDTTKWESSQEKREGSWKKGDPVSTFSGTKSITEYFSNVNEFDNKVSGTRAPVTEHSQSVVTQKAPFSYAGAVKRKSVRRTETYDADATEKLLRNFHQTWTESETVFKSLGYNVSEETTSQVVSHQRKIVSSGKELCSMKKYRLLAGTMDACSISNYCIL